jgi:hypothetical protein
MPLPIAGEVNGLPALQGQLCNAVPATFFLACIAALELDGVALDEI